MKTCIFIDGANAGFSLMKIGKKINFTKLKVYFNATQIRYYTAVFREEETGINKLQGFMDYLAYHGVIVVQKDAKVVNKNGGNSFIKGNMDIELAVDILSMCNWCDHCVLFSGDGDFSYLLRAIRGMGKLVTVVSTMRAGDTELSSDAGVLADELRKCTDEVLNMNDSLSPAQIFLERNTNSAGG